MLIDGSGPGDRARVADFGLARLQASAAVRDPAEVPSNPSSALHGPMTMMGAIAGTPGYMPSEQYLGGDVDARSDQFSFCVALYEALYQAMPWLGDGVAELAADTVVGTLRPPP